MSSVLGPEEAVARFRPGAESHGDGMLICHRHTFIPLAIL